MTYIQAVNRSIEDIFT